MAEVSSARPQEPRPSPKPLFASTNRDFMGKFLIERNKTAAWEGSTARRKVQRDMDQFNREEEEAAERLLMEYISESQDSASGEADRSRGIPASGVPVERPGDQVSPPLAPSTDRDTRQTINQLSCPTPNSAKRDGPTQQRPATRQGLTTQAPRRGGTGGSRTNGGRSGGSSYKEMLALLERTKQQSSSPRDGGSEGEEKQQQHQHQHQQQQQQQQMAPPLPPAASQETDYGDAELEDTFYEFL